MTFAAKETSRNQGIPVDLYYFQYGTGPSAFYAYTDAEEAITHAGVVYQPIPITRDAVKASGTLDKSALNIRMARNAGLGSLFRIYPPGQPVNCIIRQGHLSDPDSEYLVVWTGRILSFSRDDSEHVFVCEPVSTSLRRNGLRRHYQLTCAHALYGVECGAVQATGTVTVLISSLTPSRLTFSPGWSGANAAAKYIGGMVTWSTDDGLERRSILRAIGANTLTLSGPTEGLLVGTSVEVSVGCNHQMDDCEDLHTNIPNFGGQPWIPTKNPIKTNPFTY